MQKHETNLAKRFLLLSWRYELASKNAHVFQICHRELPSHANKSGNTHTHALQYTSSNSKHFSSSSQCLCNIDLAFSFWFYIYNCLNFIPKFLVVFRSYVKYVFFISFI